MLLLFGRRAESQSFNDMISKLVSKTPERKIRAIASQVTTGAIPTPAYLCVPETVDLLSTRQDQAEEGVIPD